MPVHASALAHYSCTAYPQGSGLDLYHHVLLAQADIVDVWAMAHWLISTMETLVDYDASLAFVTALASEAGAFGV